MSLERWVQSPHAKDNHGFPPWLSLIAVRLNGVESRHEWWTDTVSQSEWARPSSAQLTCSFILWPTGGSTVVCCELIDTCPVVGLVLYTKLKAVGSSVTTTDLCMIFYFIFSALFLFTKYNSPSVGLIKGSILFYKKKEKKKGNSFWSCDPIKTAPSAALWFPCYSTRATFSWSRSKLIAPALSCWVPGHPRSSREGDDGRHQRAHPAVSLPSRDQGLLHAALRWRPPPHRVGKNLQSSDREGRAAKLLSQRKPSQRNEWWMKYFSIFNSHCPWVISK